MKSKIPLDFILQVAQSTSINQPPIIVASPTGPFAPLAGSPLTFTVTATDPDSGDTINSLFATNPPTGMTFSGFAPGGNSASLNVSFTPTVSQANQTFVVTFQTTDNHGATASTSVTISPTPRRRPRPDAVDDVESTSKNTSIGIAAATLLANDSDPDGDPITLTAVSAASTRGGRCPSTPRPTPSPTRRRPDSSAPTPSPTPSRTSAALRPPPR